MGGAGQRGGFLGSDASEVGWPDVFVHLHLQANREGVGENSFRQLPAGDGAKVGWGGFECGMLLGGGQRLGPGKQDWAKARQVAFNQDVFGPLIVLMSGDDELDFVGGAQVSEVWPMIARFLAAAGAFEVHDPMDSGIDASEVEGAAGFEEHREAGIGQAGEQRLAGGLQQGFAAGHLDQRPPLRAEWLLVGHCQGLHAGHDFGQRQPRAFRKGVGAVTPGAPQGAAGQTDENAGAAGVRAFALDAQENLIDNQRLTHAPRLAAVGRY
jgi:hypothetical protein